MWTTPAMAELAPMDAYNVALMNDNIETGDDSIAELEMTLINKSGKQRIRKIRRYTKDYGNDEKSVLFFLEPANVKDTGFLGRTYDDAAKDDEQWLYLPAMKKVQRISSYGREELWIRSVIRRRKPFAPMTMCMRCLGLTFEIIRPGREFLSILMRPSAKAPNRLSVYVPYKATPPYNRMFLEDIEPAVLNDEQIRFVHSNIIVRKGEVDVDAVRHTLAIRASCTAIWSMCRSRTSVMTESL